MIDFIVAMLGRAFTPLTDLIGVLAAAVSAAVVVQYLAPRRFRNLALLAISLAAMLAYGASIWFITLVIFLVILTHDVSRQPPHTVSHRVGLGWACLTAVTVAGLVFIVQSLFNFAARFSSFGYSVALAALCGTFSLGILFLDGSAVRLAASLREVLSAIWADFASALKSPLTRFLSMLRLLFWLAITAWLINGIVVFPTGRDPARVPFYFWQWFALAMWMMMAVTASRMVSSTASAPLRRAAAIVALVLILLSFAILKMPVLNLPVLAQWIGYSYIAFRLIHVILDSLKGQPTESTRLEMLVYSLFLPAILVGPIDRLPRFVEDLRRSEPLTVEVVWRGGARVVMGCVSKFFFADVVLSRLAMGQAWNLAASSQVYAWIQLYAYALWLYCDFAGFVDIAIGTGQLLGVTLPDNFKSPYFKPSITEFWQSWHITLSEWLRTYIFLPFSRALIRTPLKRLPALIVLLAHLLTMLCVGLWHGFALHFALWGLWHGAGLFIHKLFADRTRLWQVQNKHRVGPMRGLSIAGVLLTFHFVALGWVLFAFPDVPQAVRFFAMLFGVRT